MTLCIRKERLEPFEWRKFIKYMDDLNDYILYRGYRFTYTLSSFNSATGIISGDKNLENPYIFVEELQKCFPDLIITEM